MRQGSPIATEEQARVRTTPLSLSCVVPTHNRASTLERVLVPLLEDAGVDEVIVVADACTDETLDILSRLRLHYAKLRYEVATFRSESASRQHGAEVARGAVLLFLDDDVVPSPGVGRRHAIEHESASDLVVFGSMPVPDALVAVSVGAYDYAEAWRMNARQWELNPAEILRHFWAGHFSIRRNVALRVGLRNPGFEGSYHPDFEFGLRCADAGLRGRYLPALAAEHLYTRSARQYLGDGWRQGVSHVLLHRARSDLRMLTTRDYAAPVPGPARMIVRLSHIAAIRRVTQAPLMAVATVLFSLGARRHARRLAWIARRQSMVAGSIEAQRSPPGNIPAAPGIDFEACDAE